MANSTTMRQRRLEELKYRKERALKELSDLAHLAGYEDVDSFAYDNIGGEFKRPKTLSKAQIEGLEASVENARCLIHSKIITSSRIKTKVIIGLCVLTFLSVFAAAYLSN